MRKHSLTFNFPSPILISNIFQAMMACPQINWLMKNIQQKILKDDVVRKLQKSKDTEKLYPSCEPDRNNAQKPRLFTDMSFAIAAIVKMTLIHKTGW